MDRKEIWNLIQEDYDNKRFFDAYSTVSDLIYTHGKDINILYMRAFLSQKMDWHRATVENCNMVLKLDPKHIEALHMKLISCDNLDWHKECFKVYNQILSIIPNDPLGLWGKAKYLFVNSKFDECNKICARLLNVETDNLDTLELILDFFEIFLRKRKEIIMICDKILNIDNKNITAYTKKAYALLSIQEYKRAIVTCNEVLLQDNTNALAISIKMNSLEALGKYREVLSLCDKFMVTPDVNNINGFLIKASMFAYLKEYSNSIRIYEKIVEMCEKRMFYMKKNPSLFNNYNTAKIQLNVVKINSNRQLSIMEGFDFLVNYLLLSLVNF